MAEAAAFIVASWTLHLGSVTFIFQAETLLWKFSVHKVVYGGFPILAGSSYLTTRTFVFLFLPFGFVFSGECCIWYGST